MRLINKKNFASQIILPLCALGASGCTLLPIGNANYLAAQKSASNAQANRDFALKNDRTATDAMKDQRLAGNVAGALAGIGFNNVLCFDQKVLIVGEVSTRADIAKATAAASRVPGVKKVWNYLTVGPNQTLNQSTADGYLASTLKQHLINRQMEHQDVDAGNIAIIARKGVIYLIGSNAGNKQIIEEITNGMKQTEGAKQVVNLID